MRIAILGKGKMGVLLRTLLIQQGQEVMGYVDEENYQRLAQQCEVLFDFSNAAKFSLLCRFLDLCPCMAVIGTTGYSNLEIDRIRKIGEVHAICYSSNYSIGIQIINRILENSMPYLVNDYNIEITEVHHRFKQDAPSGTTQLLLNTVKSFYPYKEVYGRAGIVGVRDKEEIGIHSLRGGSRVGEHSLYFMGNDEELVLTHKAFSREVYANGAIYTMHLLLNKKHGFYSLKELLFEEDSA